MPVDVAFTKVWPPVQELAKDRFSPQSETVAEPLKEVPVRVLSWERLFRLPPRVIPEMVLAERAAVAMEPALKEVVEVLIRAPTVS